MNESTDLIKIFYTNCRSSLTENKSIAVSAVATAQCSDLVFITEAGFHPGQMPNIEGFERTAYCCKNPNDSKDGSVTCGGVGVWKNINSKVKVLYCTPIKEVKLFQGVNVHTTAGNFLVFYRSPSQKRNEITDAAEVFYTQANKNYIIIGDFNVKDVDWDSATPPDATRSRFKDLVNAVKPDFATQIVREKTHIGGGILDIIVVNNSIPASYKVLEHLTPPSFDHHFMVAEFRAIIPEFKHEEIKIIDHSSTN